MALGPRPRSADCIHRVRRQVGTSACKRDVRTLTEGCQRVIGITIDDAAAGSPLVEEFRRTTGDTRPVEDASIDFCVSDFVLEHVHEPDRFLAPCARVTKRGGRICIRTRNGHSYVGVIARLVPIRAHAQVLEHVRVGTTTEGDASPTLYRCNRRRKLRAAMREHGFRACVYGYEAGPSCLSFTGWAYFLGVPQQR